MIKQHVRRLHRIFDGLIGRVFGGKPVVREESSNRQKGISVSEISDFSYSRFSHFDRFDPMRIYIGLTSNTCDLKVYQDLLMYTFINTNMQPGSRLLEIGGGESRIISELNQKYEIWNLDKLEGQGFGPKLPANGCSDRLVKDYIGNYNETLPEKYFDLVFSISTIEHFPTDEMSMQQILGDISRLTKPNGYSFHCIDALLFPDHHYVHPIVDKLFCTRHVMTEKPEFESLSMDRDKWCLSSFAYYSRWYHLTRVPLNKFGRPFSLNILWQEE